MFTIKSSVSVTYLVSIYRINILSLKRHEYISAEIILKQFRYFLC